MATKIYVVTLASAQERRLFMRKQFESCGLPFEFVEAVDARELDATEIEKVNSSREYPNPLKPAEIACAMSHERACRRFLADGMFQHAVVMEDDVIIGAHFGRVLSELERHAPAGSATLLYASAHTRLRLTPTQHLCADFNYVAAATGDNVFGALAYFLSRPTAERLCDGLVPVASIADDWARYLRQGRLDSVGIVFPFPVLHAEFLSTVNRATGSYPLRTRLKNFMYDNRIFPFFQLFLMMRRAAVERRQKQHIRLSGSPVAKTYRLR